MLYRVFDTQVELDEANERWMEARSNAGVCDCRMGNPVNPQVTNAWDNGREMLNGKIACQVPDRWATEFGGVEMELTDGDFPVSEEEV